MGILIGGVVLAVVGVILWIVKGKKEGKSATLELTDTSKVSGVMETYESLKVTVGDGNFTHFCELKGKAHADSPLKSELAGVDCVYYSSKVIRKYEQREWRKDSQGNKRQQWVKKSDTVSDNVQWANGWGVKDDTGFIAIDPAKAELHAEQVHSSFEKGEPGANSALSVKIGGFSLGIGSSNPDYRLIGYEQKEMAIKMGTDLYVLGDANDREGRLQVSKPKEKGQPFIVSTKSEDELVSGIGSSIKGLKIGAFVCWGLGAVAVVAGLLQAVGVF